MDHCEINYIAKMLSRQTANSNRLETMAEELQSESGNCPASSGEHSSAKKISVEKVKKGSGKKRGRPKKHIGERSTGANVDMKDSCVGDEIPKIGDFHPSGEHWSAKKNNVEKVKKGSGKKRGRPKKHIGERSTGANVDMKDSCEGDEIPKIGDCHPSGKDLVVAPVSCRKQPRNGVKRHNGMLRKTEKTPMLEGKADATQYQVIPNPAYSHEIDNAKYDYMMINGDSVLDDNQTLSMCYNARLPIGSDDSILLLFSGTLPVDIQDDNGTPSDHGNTVRSSDLPNTDGPRDVPDLNQCAELNDEGEEVGRAAILSTDSMENEDGGDVGTAAFVSTDSMESEETIPFVKRSPLWESICSGKAYMKIKRKPHFQPLKEQEEVLREGSAIGLVVSFNNLCN
ncbi:uncharacterized protein LOC141663740 isoform X1 [Apium graveolens]|uniref:uncharacterized protein LOC141663740 isoform X1 n=1 Tax=Apium graveolens TaxID=4045 RepID=UPI003D7B28BC